MISEKEEKPKITDPSQIRINGVQPKRLCKKAKLVGKMSDAVKLVRAGKQEELKAKHEKLVSE